MNILTIAQSLEKKYLPMNTDLSLAGKKHDYLSECIIPSDITVYSGQGATLQTNIGTMIDFSSMTVNCILGQNDPWVNANLIAYLLSGRPSFLTTRLGSEFYYKVAKKICDVTTIKNPVINHRQCNGTDVSELAVLSAFKHRKPTQNKIVSFNGSYHGQGLTAYMISALQRHHQFLTDDAPVIFLDFPDNTTNPDSQKLTVHDNETLTALLKRKDEIFAVIIEPIQVNNRVNTPSKAFMKKLSKICKENEIALIFDEAQTGFGWLGTMTAAERYETQPAMIALSKAVTSGYGPMATLVTEKQYQDVEDGAGAKTNGSDVRSLVASNAVIERLLGITKSSIPDALSDQLKKELHTGLLKSADKKVSLLVSYLKKLQKENSGLIKSINGDGLIRGLEIVNPSGKADNQLTKKLQDTMMRKGVFVRYNHNCLVVKPPLVITDEELAQGFEIMSKVLKKYR